jgi:hypothetical protein
LFRNICRFTFYKRSIFNIFTDVIGAVYEVAAEKRSFGSKKFPTTVSLADAEYVALKRFCKKC